MENLANIPIFTKIYGIVVLSFGLLVSLKVVNPLYLIFLPQAIFQGQIWRIFTAPFFLGKLDMNLIMRILSSFMMVKKLEEQHFSHRLSNLIFIFILLCILTMSLSAIFGSFFVGSSVLSGLIYIYSKLYSNTMVNLMMVIPINVQWLPFTSLLIDLLNNMSMLPDLIGLASGHIIFYLLFVLPVLIKRPLLKTPTFLSRLLDDTNFIPEGEQRNNAFGGRAHRVNE
ncbi:Derlin-1 [Histomonas meleagridis]|uniref:Derlin-1 n=1 Tax=Histomonas meleagridis TaxID=135588 RepID=UPI0035598A6B|nr:Derlin-1 [Histomonas meleagridis]KAH0804895.1 Derlin-1 [Histomonas meleagridis]